MALAALQMRARQVHAEERSLSGRRRSCCWSRSAASRRLGSSRRHLPRKSVATRNAVMPREGGASSTLRPIDSIIDVSGILDHPHARVMTTECDFAFSRRAAPEVCMNLSLQDEGAGNAGCLLHPRSRVQWCKELRTRAYRYSRSTPAFPAQWVDGLCRALPGDEFVLSP